MPAEKKTDKDYDSLSSSPSKSGEGNSRDHASMSSSRAKKTSTNDIGDRNLKNLSRKKKPVHDLQKKSENDSNEIESQELKPQIRSKDKAVVPEVNNGDAEDIETNLADDLSYSERVKLKSQERQSEKDEKLLDTDNWLIRSGHGLTYVGLFLFSCLVFFRPYEMHPSLSFLSGTAVYFAVATLLVYIPTQYMTEGNFTVLSTEVKCVFVMTFISMLSLLYAKDRGLAWEVFNEEFIKAVMMFIVMVNVLRTRKRLMGMIWLSLSIGVYLSYMVTIDSILGIFRIEGTRVAVEIGGLFGNPNDMALHLVTIVPVALALGVAAKGNLTRIIYFLMTGLFVVGLIVTESRGGFLGLLAVGGVLAWKLGRNYRMNVTLISIAVFGLSIIAAPGSYGMRILSIFLPGLDQTGSSDQRTALLKRSILVSIRNPWGIGIGNFPVVGQRNLETHNAYTQVSSEIGVLGLLVYLIFMISPFRKLGAIERKLFDKGKTEWFYYLSIGLQASILGFMVSSFFLSVAYNWYIYYIIAYAVAFRRIYHIENKIEGENESSKKSIFGLRLNSV